MCTVQDRKRHSVEDAGPAGPGVADPRLVDVFLRERERLARIAAGMGMDRADADDVLQDVSVQVLKNADRFEQENVMVR
ncbi:MAG TPA: sigma factor [Sedimentisphaerales bacterium]|jgi:DNA-directed RNA polymerase specialized sigma24 family protein|nr:sigma factor [Sedimentisphaerales bacterium]HNU28520.1 sigma factor [Sedimentisphaerales bacterium]